MRRDGDRYVARVQLEELGPKKARRFGDTRVPRRLRTLRLRAYVPEGAHSNIVVVRVRR